MRAAFLVLQAEVAGLRAQTGRQDYLIAELRQALYGKRSEQLDPGDRQLALKDLETAVAEAAAANDASVARNADGSTRRPTAKRNLGHLPDHLRQVKGDRGPAGAASTPKNTRAPGLDPGAGKTRTGDLWALTRDGRGWNGGDPPAVVFTSAPGCRGSHAMDRPHGALTAACRVRRVRKQSGGRFARRTAMPGMTRWPNPGASVARL